MIDRCDPTGMLLSAKKLSKGDQVKVSKGPFTNFIANVETYENDRRIWVLMDLMGRTAKIQTSVENLQLSI